MMNWITNSIADDGFLLIIVGFVLLLSFGIVGATIRALIRRRRISRSQPIETMPATFLGATSESRHVNDNFSSQSVMETASNRVTQYYLRFRLKNNRKVTFKAKKKVALAYHDGDIGHLTYQDDRFISFVVTGKGSIMEESYFAPRKRTSPLVMFYGEAQALGLSVPSDKPIKCDKADLAKLVNDLQKDASDWFFVIKNERHEQLQVEREGIDDVVCNLNVKGEESITKLNLKKLGEHIEKLFS